jgi:hypothetical protein
MAAQKTWFPTFSPFEGKLLFKHYTVAIALAGHRKLLALRGFGKFA